MMYPVQATIASYSVRLPSSNSTHEIQAIVEEVQGRYLAHTAGDVATYIPELIKANPDEFGVCLATTDGRVFEAGHCDRLFTIQSISKPFVFGMAIEECGHAEVFKRVDVEPSGDAFNAIELQTGTNRPYNPMVNAGAITGTVGVWSSARSAGRRNGTSAPAASAAAAISSSSVDTTTRSNAPEAIAGRQGPGGEDVQEAVHEIAVDPADEPRQRQHHPAVAEEEDVVDPEAPEGGRAERCETR